MQQKANSECKVSIRLDARSVTVNRKNIALTPLVEPLIPALLKVPDDVGKCMGVSFIPKKLDIVIVDEMGLKKVRAEERAIKDPDVKNITGSFFCGKEAIFLNPEGYTFTTSMDENSERYANALNNSIRTFMINTAWHEAAHFNHYAYAPSFFTLDKGLTMTERFERLKKERDKKSTLQQYRDMYILMKDFPKLQLHSVVWEGVARWVDRKLAEAYFGSEPQLKELWERPKGFSLIGKINGVFNEKHELGDSFMDMVEGMTGANPVKIVLDNPPKSYLELFYPITYLMRLKKEKVI
ncbi:MAG: hypothetical protein V1492_04905 [Candidatus Micrarchaeota archaeon]